MCGHWVWVRGPFWQHWRMWVTDAGCGRPNWT